MTRHALPYKLFALFAIVIAVVLVAGSLFLMAQIDNQRTIAENELTFIAQSKVDEIVRWRENLIDDAVVLSMGPPLAGLVADWLEGTGTADEAAVVAALESITRHKSYDGVLLFDGDAELRQSVGGFAGPIHQAVLDVVEQCLRDQRALLIDLHLDANGRPHVGVAAPVFSPLDSGAPVAVIVLQSDAQHVLYPVIQSWPISSESAETLLVRRDGDSVLFLNELRHLDGAALTLHAPLSDTYLPAVMAVLGNEGVVEGTDYRGVDVIAVVHPVPDSPWFMVAKVDRDEVLATAQSTSTMIVALILAMLLAVVMVFGFLWQRRDRAHYVTLLAAQERIAEGEQRFRLLVESSPDAIFVQTDGRFAYANAAALRLFAAATPEDLLGTPVLDRVPEASREISRARITLINRDKGSVPHVEGVYLTMNGTPVPVESTAVPVHFQGSDGALVFVRDITERKQSMEALHKSEEALRSLNLALEHKVAERTSQLAESNRELEAFAYSVSHDLRAPLRAIEGFSRILLEDHAEALDTEAHRLLGVVRSSAARMDRLITDLLQLSRVTQAALNPVSVDMAEIAQSVCDELLSAGIGEHFEFVVRDLPLAHGDPILLKRVWYNLLSNAFKFTARSATRRVEVGGSVDGTVTTFYVRDTGVGFDARYAHQLFGVFQRLHSRDEFEGTGIGLAIVQRIVHRHGGRVWAEGEIGRGATFYFALPRGVDSDVESTK